MFKPAIYRDGLAGQYRADFRFTVARGENGIGRSASLSREKTSVTMRLFQFE